VALADAGSGDDPIIRSVNDAFQVTIGEHTLRRVAAPTDNLCIASRDNPFSLWFCLSGSHRLCRRLFWLRPAAHDDACIVTAKAE